MASVYQECGCATWNGTAKTIQMKKLKNVKKVSDILHKLRQCLNIGWLYTVQIAYIAKKPMLSHLQAVANGVTFLPSFRPSHLGFSSLLVHFYYPTPLYGVKILLFKKFKITLLKMFKFISPFFVNGNIFYSHSFFYSLSNRTRSRQTGPTLRRVKYLTVFNVLRLKGWFFYIKF